MKLLILGGTGMLGYQVVRTCIKRDIDFNVVVRNKKLLLEKIGTEFGERTYTIDDVKNIAAIEEIIRQVKPEIVINCIGIVKQSHLAENYYESVAINAFLPHQLQKLGMEYNFRLIHISTDCVFDGKKGRYKESDPVNAYDLYGKSKHLGEVGYGSGITLRTSIIGHEITNETHGLLEWFLAQDKKVRGFTKAIFSGLTTLELTNVILNVVIPGNLDAGIYHVSVNPISKYDLLKIIAKEYKKDIEIEPSDSLVLDRSLDSSLFANLTGYKIPEWSDLIKAMRSDHTEKIKV